MRVRRMASIIWSIVSLKIFTGWREHIGGTISFKPPLPSGEIDPNMFLLFVQGPDIGLKANDPVFNATYLSPPMPQTWEALLPAIKNAVALRSLIYLPMVTKINIQKPS